MSLHASALNPVIEAPWSAAATLHPRASVLKFAMYNHIVTILRYFSWKHQTLRFTRRLSNTGQMTNNTSMKVLSHLFSSNKAQNLQPVTILTTLETSVRLTCYESSLSSPSIHPHHYTSKFCKTYLF